MNGTTNISVDRHAPFWFYGLILAAAMFPGFAQTLDHFEFASTTLTAPKGAYGTFQVLINARSSTGALVRSYTGTVQLTASNLGAPIAVEALDSLKFTSGQWLGRISINEPGAEVILRVRDPGTGRLGTSGPIRVDPANFRVLDLPIISVVSDRLRGFIYASAGPTNGVTGTILVINPATGDIVDSHALPGGVDKLELSDDASRLYAVTEDQLKIRRLRLPEFSEEATLSLGEWEPGKPNYAADLAIQPGHPEVVAVVKKRRGITPWYTGISVFEDTVEKPFSNLLGEANVLEWGDTPGRLYGFNNQTSPNNFNQYDYTSAGVALVANRRNILTLFNGDIRCLAGRLYSSTGRIIDPENFKILGELPGGDANAVMLALPDRKRIVYFTPASIGIMFTYDSDTLQLLGSQPFPTPRGYGSGAAFWGANGIAFHDGKRLFLAENQLIPAGLPADLRVTAGFNEGAPEPGIDHQMQAFVRNLGPGDSGPLVIRIDGPVDTVLSGGSVVSQAAETTLEDRKLTLELPSLAAGTQVEVRFSARSVVSAWQPFSILATAAGVDPNSSNNAAGLVMKAAPLPSQNSPLIIRLAARTMVVDRSRGLLIIAPNLAGAPWGNSIMTIHPASGAISQPFITGSRPSELAVSDDGKYLYVGFQGNPEVRRYLLPSLQPDLTISLGADGFSGPRFAGNMEVRPGHPNEIAVIRNNSTVTAAGWSYYRDATELPPDRATPDLLAFAGPDRVYAWEGSWGFFKFDLAENGPVWNAILRDSQYESDEGLTYSQGKLYFSVGAVYDAETGVKAGTFNMFGPYGPAPIIDQSAGRALFLQRNFTNYNVNSFNLTNYTLAASSIVAGISGTANSWGRWSADGLAFSASSGVAIFKTDLLGSPPETLRVESVSLGAGAITLRFGTRSAGQYVIEYCNQLGTNWTTLGDPFPETVLEKPIARPTQTQFLRLVRLP